MTSSSYERLFFPTLKRLDPESAHDHTLTALALAQSNPAGRATLKAIAGTVPARPMQVGGPPFPHPTGIAPGI